MSASGFGAAPSSGYGGSAANYPRWDRTASDPFVGAGAYSAPHTTMPIAQLDESETLKTEIVQMMIAWLLKEGLTSSAQLLREEATAKLRTDHYQRKTVRTICRSVEEQNWDGAQKAMRKLSNSILESKRTGVTYMSALANSLPFLLSQQQFLELVDGDNGQKTYNFFMRNIKPFESVIGKECYLKLSYLLTCKCVSEAERQYPEFRSWSPEVGRSQLLLYIHKMMNESCVDAYCRQGNVMTGAELAKVPLPDLSTVVAKAVSFDILAERNPSLVAHLPASSIQSLVTPLHRQLPPIHPLCTIDVNAVVRATLPSLHSAAAASTGATSNAGAATSQSGPAGSGAATSKAHQRVRVSCCQPFFSSSAIVVGTYQGTVLYLTYASAPQQQQQQQQYQYVTPQATGPPLAFSGASNLAASSAAGESGSASATTALNGFTAASAGAAAVSAPAGERAVVLYQHSHAIKRMERNGSRLLCCGGSQVLVMNLSPLVETSPHSAGETDLAIKECVVNVFTHTADVRCGTFFPCGSILLSGLSEGTITMWDATNGAKMMENTFSSSAMVSVVVNRAGSVYYAASKDGVIRAVDTATGIQVFMMASSIALELSSIALSPSSGLLLASYRGGTVRLWDTITGNLLPLRFAGVENNTRASVPVCFGQCDGFIFAGSEDGNMFYWNLTRDATATPAQGDSLFSSQVHHNLPGADPYRTFEMSCRWPRGEIKHPHTQLPLHRSCVSDIKSEDKYEVSCSEDGIIAVCVSIA